MYVSRLLLNPAHGQVRRELSDVYELHRTVMASFAEELPAHERILFRLEDAHHSQPPMLLVQSQTEPSWGRLQKSGYLLPDDPFSGMTNPAVKSFDVSFLPGQKLRFRLRANPSKRCAQGDAKGKRVDLVQEKDQAGWMERKAQAMGCRLMGFDIRRPVLLQGRQDSGQKRHRIRFRTVLFEGMFQVEEPDDLRAAICQGIGSGKGFGCGLLSVARVPD